MSLLKVAGTTASSGTLYVNDVFSTWLYTGNGATQTITNGIDLAGKGGLVWVKSRSAATNNFLFDTTRGVNVEINSNTTDANATLANSVTAFNSSGFALGSAAGINVSAATYVSWTFREAPNFFDVVTYTGTGSARTIAHNLGVAPGMVIVKRTDTTGNWQVYHRGLTSAANSIQLNLTNAQASAPTVWNSTAPTSSVFSVGTDATVNASGGTYVAYLYAHDTSSTGIIQCGSFTTDGSGNATVNLGWEPQYFLTKATTFVDNWQCKDTMRGIPWGGAAATIYPNTTAAESNLSAYPHKLSATGLQVTYEASQTYIYMAIRRPNKPPTTGTQVFSPITSSAATGTKLTTNFAIDMQLSTYRAGTVGTYDIDILRGVSSTSTESGLLLATASTSAESASGLGRNWDNTSFEISSAYGGSSIVYWDFKRAPGFFDEVCWTGDGTLSRDIYHNLGTKPNLIIIKSRSGAYLWSVSTFEGSDYATSIMALNTTGANGSASAGGYSGYLPSTTQFRLSAVGGVVTSINQSASTYVAYLFATLAGISKVGSYTGNGTGQAIACGFYGGARFVLIKRTDSTGDWYTFDSARGLTSGSSPYLLLNSTAAEVTGNNGVYASTGGFTLGATASTTTNISGASYIFLSVS